MVTETIIYKCRGCGSSNIVKNGHNASGSQQFWCKDCGKRGVLKPRRGYTEEQKEQIRILFGEMRDRITRMRRQGAGPDELRAEFQRLRERNKTAVLGILTPEQREKYKRLLGARAATPRQRGQIWVIGPDGKPSSVDVITGISDGSHTEILRGDLRPGQEVIVGTVLSSGRLSGGSKRFGF